MSENIVSTAESTRSVNMAKRRALILSHARNVIANEGFDALRLRDLAERAGITVPTIYNLIGGKKDILTLIIEEPLKRLEIVHNQIREEDIEKVFEAQIDARLELFSSNEQYYKAAYIAGDRIGLFEQSSASGLYKRSLQLTDSACRKAKDAGLLYGKVAPEKLSQQIYSCYRLARQDWVNGYIDLKTLRRQALTGVFLTLAADAKPSFRTKLIQYIEAMP
jgi:AcrR family transcriptional regulator